MSTETKSALIELAQKYGKSKGKSGIGNRYISVDLPVSLPIGQPVLDHNLGSAYMVQLPDGNLKKQINLGLPAGTFTQLVGTPGAGKTAMAIQSAYNMVEPFGDDSYVIHCDNENAVSMPRIRELTGADEKYLQEHYNIQKDLTLEDILDFIMDRKDQIEEDKDRYLYNTHVLSIQGEEIWYYKPIVIILDSVMKINGREEDKDEMQTATGVTRNAQAWGTFLKPAIEIMGKYNINIIAINHLGKEITMTGFHSKKQLLFSPNNSNIPGGKYLLHYSTSIICLQADTTQKSLRKEDENGYDGYPVLALASKTRSPGIGTTAALEYSMKSGFDPRFTLLNFAKSKDLLIGRNPSMHFIDSDLKFDERKFITELKDKPELLKILIHTCKPELEKLIKINNPFDDDDILTGRKPKSELRSLLNSELY